MVNRIDVSKKFYDPMYDFRDMVLAGALSNSPRIITDPLSKNITDVPPTVFS